MTHTILISTNPLDVNHLIIDSTNNTIGYSFDEPVDNTDEAFIQYYTGKLQWAFHIVDPQIKDNLSIERISGFCVVYTPDTAAHNQQMLEEIKKQNPGVLNEKDLQICRQIISEQKLRESNAKESYALGSILNGWTISKLPPDKMELPTMKSIIIKSESIRVTQSAFDRGAQQDRATRELTSELDKPTPDLNYIRQLLDNDIGYNIQGKKTGKTIAHIAAQQNDIAMLKRLRIRAARFDLCTTERGEPPLCYARTMDAANELIWGNASLLQKNKAGIQVFEIMNNKRTFSYRLLLNLELDKREKANPALIYALILKCPNDEHLGRITGWSPVHVAVASNNFELLNKLFALEESVSEETNQTSRTPIFYATSTEMVEALLMKDPLLLNAKARDGVSAVRYLFDTGVSSPTIDLIIELEKHKPSMTKIKHWLKQGANPLSPEISLYRKLFKHCDKGDASALKKVILQHAQMTNNNSVGIQELMIRCSARHIEGHRRRFLFTLKQWLLDKNIDTGTLLADVNQLSMRKQILSQHFNPIFEQANVLFSKNKSTQSRSDTEKYSFFSKGANKANELPDVFLGQSKNKEYNKFLEKLMKEQKSASPQIRAAS